MLTKLYLCWDVVIEPQVWREGPNPSLPEEALLTFAFCDFSWYWAVHQCSHNLFHTNSPSHGGLSVALLALARRFFSRAAPRLSKLRRAHKSSGGWNWYLLYYEFNSRLNDNKNIKTNLHKTTENYLPLTHQTTYLLHHVVFSSMIPTALENGSSIFL